MEFTEERIERYSRHILLSDVGIEGQIKIAQSKVLIIGAGGLGAPISLYLAAAGVGTIGIVDGDCVDLSNLQRQICHFTDDIKTEKVISAKNKMTAINPDIKVKTFHQFVNANNISELIRNWDFIIDGTDNLAIKFLINDACLIENKPLSHGGILRYEGQTMTILPHQTVCYRCLFLSPPPPDAVPTCSQAGVLGAIAGMLGSIQATETLKFILGVGNLLTNRLMSFDARAMTFREVKTKIRKDCPCQTGKVILEDPIEVACDLRKKDD